MPSLDPKILRDRSQSPKRSIHCSRILGMLNLLVITVGLPGQLNRALHAQSATTPAVVSVIGFDDVAIKGQLIAAATDRVIVKTDRETIQRSANDVSRIEFSNKMETAIGPIEVMLTDGSKLRGDQLSGKNQSWQLISGGDSVAIPNQSIRSALLKALPAELSGPWQSAVAESTLTDAVIVLRAGNTLDRINGVISQIKDKQVVFELDGQPIEIPIEKIAGLIWFRRGLERVKPTIEIALVDQSLWFAETLNWLDNGRGLEIKTQLGQTSVVPLTKIVRINYANAVIRWLAELESLESVADKRLDLKTRIPSLDRALASRFVSKDRSSQSTIPSDQDLWFPSPGRFVFRVPEGFTSLQSKIERSDQGSQRTDLKVEVLQDDQSLWQGKIPASQDSLEVDVRVTPGKKVRLVVGCDSKLMIGSEVMWRQPRLKR